MYKVVINVIQTMLLRWWLYTQLIKYVSTLWVESCKEYYKL